MAAEGSAVRLRGAAWRGAGPGRAESGPSEALVSFADLGGAGSDAARFVGAPRVYLFIYRVCLRVRALHCLAGRGRGEGRGPVGAGTGVETPRDL